MIDVTVKNGIKVIKFNNPKKRNAISKVLLFLTSLLSSSQN